MVLFPEPLRPGDLIAVTAPSSGVLPTMHSRLELAIEHLRAQGFRVIEGACLRDQRRSTSAPRNERAAELMRFLQDPEVAAVIPPWGGELASELLDVLDFEGLRDSKPKWMLGYSDTSTLLMPLTLVTGWATAHGPNLMDLVPTQSDPLTTGAMSVLASHLQDPVVQASSERYQVNFVDYADQFDEPLQLTEPTRWKRLDGSDEALEIRGRLIGGCFDTVTLLAGSQYGDVPAFIQSSGSVGAILYLENVSQSPGGVVRLLLSLRRHGWLEGLSGLLLGRSTAAPEENPADLHYEGALISTLGQEPFPVLFDLDIGHRPPQMTLINGAFASVCFEGGAGTISQASTAFDR
ncbi:S66 family peptidase [Saltatorellus ferox]